MVNSMVGRATSDMLIGPDWAMNIEICDICNHDPVQAKDVVKGIKKRLGSRNPKVQLLALTLLETIVKNCGDFVHMHVAEKGLLNDMVKICKKRPEFHVKEKILVLIDTWQEVFGGARARYPQYYAAYHELLRLGAVFPQKSEERSTPVLTPPQTQPLSSYRENTRHLENENGAATSSVESEFPTLSLTEMQNARGIMDVLSEMLTAVDPEKKEGLRQEVIVDLVEQCRTYKRRVVHLVNSTSDESLLCQGLALNDDLQRVLNKHESLLTGIPIPSEKSKVETSQTKSLVPVNAPLIDATETKQKESVNGVLDLISLAPITTTNGTTSTSTALVKFDLLSGDDYNSPTAGDSLAIVPVGTPQPATPVSQQNALALVLSNNNSSGQMYSSPQIQQPQNMPPQQGGFYQNGNSGYNQGLNPMWNGQMAQQQPRNSPGFGGTSGGGMPPPPWEAQTTDNQYGGPQYSQPQNLQSSTNYNNMNMNMNMNQQQQYLGNQIPQMNQQPLYNNQFPQQLYVMPHQQMPYLNNPQQMAQQMYNNQMAQQMAQRMYNNQMAQQAYGYGYNQQQSAQYIDQRMAGMSVREDTYLNSTVYTGPSMANASYVHVPSGKPTKAEDKLFGDLVDFSKVKPKTTPGRTGM